MGKYEEALERAKEWEREHPNGYVIRDMMEYIFPGYNDSKDERIRKAIGVAICGTKATSILEANGTNLPEALDYLEKQKEQAFTHHEIDESLRDAVTHQMEDDGDVDDFVRRGIDDIVLKYAELGARWQKEQKPVARENDFVSKPQTSVEILRHYLVWAGNSESEEDCPYTWRALADAIRDGIKALEEQKPAEWSEEDGLARDFLLKHTEQSIKVLESLSREKYIGKKGIVDVASELSNWKNARQFILSLHPHWKPSEEQMGWLESAVKLSTDKPHIHGIIVSLYEQLKRL